MFALLLFHVSLLSIAFPMSGLTDRNTGEAKNEISQVGVNTTTLELLDRGFRSLTDTPQFGGRPTCALDACIYGRLLSTSMPSP